MKPTSIVRRWMKKSVSHACHETGLTRGVLRLLRRTDSKRRLIVVVYHKVFPSLPCEPSDGMPPDIFRDQIATLKEVFDVRGPDESTAALDDPDAPPGASYPLLVTFDDGFVNNAEHALPILQECAVPALFFVATRLLGTDGFLWTDEVRELLLSAPHHELRLYPGTEHEEALPLPDRVARLESAAALKSRLKRLPVREFEALLDEIRKAAQVEELRHHPGTRMLSWQEVRRLAACGMTIGSHTDRHFVVTLLSDEELESELRASREAIEKHTGEAPRYFAYPNGHEGDFDARTAAQVARTGITHAFTMISDIATEDDSPLTLPRYCPSSVSGAMVAFDLLQVLVRQRARERWHALGRGRLAPVIPIRGHRQAAETEPSPEPTRMCS